MISLKLMADFRCRPLWNVSPKTFGTVDPNELPISEELKTRLLAWAAEYDATLNETYPPDSQFETAEAETSFKRAGRELGQRLQEELGGDYQIVLHQSLLEE